MSWRSGFAAVAMALAAGGAVAHDAHDHSAHAGAASGPALTPVEIKALDYFSDTIVVDQDGRERRFFSDLLRDRVVAVTFFYTDCADACPIMNQMMSHVQDGLGDRLGQDVFILSITVDPQTDTVDKLAAYRQQFNARDGWDFVTGTPEAIETVNRKLGNVADREAHSTTVLIGDPSTGRWRKVGPQAGPDVIATVLKDFADGVYDDPPSQ